MTVDSRPSPNKKVKQCHCQRGSRLVGAMQHTSLDEPEKTLVNRSVTAFPSLRLVRRPAARLSTGSTSSTASAMKMTW
jgi:hypothetical protein